MDMGRKPIYELITESGRSIRTTGNHPYLVKAMRDNKNRSLFERGLVDTLENPYFAESPIASAYWTKVYGIRVGDEVAVTNNEKLLPTVADFFNDSRKSYQSQSQSQNRQNKIEDKQVAHDFIWGNLMLKNQNTKAINNPAITGSSWNFSKTAGIATEARATVPISAEMSDILSSWSLESFTFPDYTSHDNLSMGSKLI